MDEKAFLISYKYKEGPHRARLFEIIKEKEGIAKDKSISLPEIHLAMSEWLKTYLESVEFLSRYKYPRTLALVAESTFWLVKLGLEEEFKTISFIDLKHFKPLEQVFSDLSGKSNKLKQVYTKLTLPDVALDASFALWQAALVIYVKENGLSKFKEEEKSYKA